MKNIKNKLLIKLILFLTFNIKLKCSDSLTKISSNFSKLGTKITKNLNFEALFKK